VIGTAAGLSDFTTIVLSIALAFLFGYTLTSLPLLRAGLALGAVIPIALASDTLSIGLMEIVDNLIMVVIPGALHAGLGDILFWGSLSFALAVAGVAAFPLNRWLLARGKGHAAVHKTGIHGGPPVRLVGAIAVAAALFGSVVLAAEAVDGDGGGGHGGSMEKAMDHGSGGDGASGMDHATGREPAVVRGLSASEGGLTLELGRRSLPSSGRGEVTFRVLGDDGNPVRDFEVEHEKRMHFIVARRDLTGFWHLHPQMDSSGTWRVDVSGPNPGEYRVFADFKHEGANRTLAADLTVAGPAQTRTLPKPSSSARTVTGYQVQLAAAHLRAGHETELSFRIMRGGRPVAVEPYLGAGGHLVALRERDLAFLHVHPVEGASDKPVAFMTKFPAAGTYRLFLQFKDGGRVHTAAFTQDVAG
jgi:hypothetical protein